MWCCILTLQRSLYAIVVPRLALLAFTICQPLVLNRFLIFLDDDPESKNVGYGLIGAYGLVYFGIAGSQALYWHRNGRSVTMFRGILISAVFSKATEISITTADNNAPVTLMSSDVSLAVFGSSSGLTQNPGRSHCARHEADPRVLGHSHTDRHSHLAFEQPDRIRRIWAHNRRGICSDRHRLCFCSCQEVHGGVAGKDTEANRCDLAKPSRLYVILTY